jgi:hypothetical protein
MNRMKRTGKGLGETHMSALARMLGRHQTPDRFWIISMMLVLIGLASLKLR